MQASGKKVKQTPHEARIRQSLDRQVSMQDRLSKVRQVVDAEAPEDMTASERQYYVTEEIKAYQKPELIRQAIKNVKNNADAQRAKRERETFEIKSPSKIKKNLKTQKKVRSQSANLNAKKAAMKSTFARDVDDEGLKTIEADLNVSHEKLG